MKHYQEEESFSLWLELHAQGFIQDFWFGGGNVNAIEGVEGMRKHAPTRGSGGMLPPQNF